MTYGEYFKSRGIDLRTLAKYQRELLDKDVEGYIREQIVGLKWARGWANKRRDLYLETAQGIAWNGYQFTEEFARTEKQGLAYCIVCKEMADDLLRLEQDLLEVKE